jgi:hypothetical protein
MLKPYMAAIVIGKPGADHIEIAVSGRHPVEPWLTGTLRVSAGPWRAEIGASFYKGELRQFATEIEKLHRELIGSAHFSPMEPTLVLKLTGDGKGHIEVSAKAQDLRSSNAASLMFTLELDQTELLAIAAALRSADAM